MKYKRKSERKLVFTATNMAEAKERISQGESRRSVASSMGVAESTLRSRLKEVSHLLYCNVM